MLRRLQALALLSCTIMAAALLVFDEVLAVKLLGQQERNIPECAENNLMGQTAQLVCILDDRVIKVPRSCASMQEVFQCKWRLWKQQYTNKHWQKSYSQLPFIADVISYDGKTIEMERALNAKDVEPQRKANYYRLQQLDLWLESNDQIMLDVQVNSNVFLDQKGGLKFVDFNIMPSWSRGLIERYDTYAKRITPFKNIYGNEGIRSWIA